MDAEIEKLISSVNDKIDGQPESEVKNEMKFLLTTLIEFVASRQPAILLSSTPPEKVGGLFFKMIGSIATDAMTAMVSPFHKKSFERSVENIMKLWPLLKKYSNISDDGQ